MVGVVNADRRPYPQQIPTKAQWLLLQTTAGFEDTSNYQVKQCAAVKRCFLRSMLYTKRPRRIQAAEALGTVIIVVKSDLFTSIENNTRTSEKWTVVTAD